MSKETKQLTKLRVRVIRPPISIFEMVKGKQDIDRTEYFEHGWDDPEHLFWMVPDGTYLCTQGNIPCMYTVKDGEVTVKRLDTQVPLGNLVDIVEADGSATVYATVAKAGAKGGDKNDIANIMHTRNKEEDKKRK